MNFDGQLDLLDDYLVLQYMQVNGVVGAFGNYDECKFGNPDLLLPCWFVTVVVS